MSAENYRATNGREWCSNGLSQHRVGVIAVCVALSAAPLMAQERAIDTQRSTIAIHVGKSGLLSAAAHDHTISAPISSGSLQETPTPRIEFTVQAAAMTVKPDPRIDAKTQATIQMDMEEITLEAKKFPEITFRSNRIEKVGNDQWNVDGDLSLHGVTKLVSLTVKQSGDSWVTRTVLKQTDFGIKPISVAGGMVKVKDEIQIDFQIFARPL
jgi:polyisoprenoid-binding protein YceI